MTKTKAIKAMLSCIFCIITCCFEIHHQLEKASEKYTSVDIRTNDNYLLLYHFLFYLFLSSINIWQLLLCKQKKSETLLPHLWGYCLHIKRTIVLNFSGRIVHIKRQRCIFLLPWQFWPSTLRRCLLLYTFTIPSVETFLIAFAFKIAVLAVIRQQCWQLTYLFCTTLLP